MNNLLSLLGGRVELASLPTSRAFAFQDRATIDDAAGTLTGIKRVPATEPTSPAAADAEPGEADSVARFRAAVAELGSALNLSAEDRAATEANPAEREAFLRQYDALEPQAKKDALAAAKAAAADRVRRASTALQLAQEARKARG